MLLLSKIYYSRFEIFYSYFGSSLFHFKVYYSILKFTILILKLKRYSCTQARAKIALMSVF